MTVYPPFTGAGKRTPTCVFRASGSHPRKLSGGTKRHRGGPPRTPTRKARDLTHGPNGPMPLLSGVLVRESDELSQNVRVLR